MKQKLAKTKKINKIYVVLAVATVVLAVLLVSVCIVGRDSRNRAASVQADVVDTLSQSASVLYKDEATHECNGLSDRICTVTHKMLVGGDASKATFETYFKQKGWLSSDTLKLDNYFFDSRTATSTVSSEAHTIRHLNDNESGLATTSHISVYESKKVPEPNGQQFLHTSFSYTDVAAYQSAKQNDLPVYIVLVRTEYVSFF
jgi:hypothetical protein